MLIIFKKKHRKPRFTEAFRVEVVFYANFFQSKNGAKDIIDRLIKTRNFDCPFCLDNSIDL